MRKYINTARDALDRRIAKYDKYYAKTKSQDDLNPRRIKDDYRRGPSLRQAAAMPDGPPMSSPDLDAAFDNFERLSPATAQRVMRFWQVQFWQHTTAGE